MSKIRRLVDSYSRYISVPWRSDAAAAQRVIFCVYNEDYELYLRAKIDEFEIATKQSGHEWAVYDLTDTFADWLARARGEARPRSSQLVFTQSFIAHLENGRFRVSVKKVCRDPESIIIEERLEATLSQKC